MRKYILMAIAGFLWRKFTGSSGRNRRTAGRQPVSAPFDARSKESRPR